MKNFFFVLVFLGCSIMAYQSKAQSGSPSSPPPKWWCTQITFSGQGVTTNSYGSVPFSWNNQPVAAQNMGAGFGNLPPLDLATTITSNGQVGEASINNLSVTLTYEWTTFPGNPPSPQPPPLNLLVTPKALVSLMYYNTEYVTWSGIKLDDGFSYYDALSETLNSKQMTGKHILYRYDPSGIITITLPVMQASSQASMFLPMISDQIHAQCAVNTRLDTRSVLIAAPQTYYKGPNNTRLPNTRAPDGTMYGDTVIPDDSESNSQSYQAVYAGQWGLNPNTGQYVPNQYHWYSSLKQDAQSGSFTCVPKQNISPLNETYTSSDFSSTGGSDSSSLPTDHIFIDVIDGYDGAHATANFYMRFHPMFDNFVETQCIRHPLPTNGPTKEMDRAGTYGEWSLVASFVNGSDVPQNFSRTVSISPSLTVTASTEISGEVGFDIEDFNAKVSRKIGDTVGKTVQVTYTVTVSATVPAHNVVDVFAAPLADEYQGTYDLYGSDGYQGTYTWSALKPYGGLHGAYATVQRY